MPSENQLLKIEEYVVPVVDKSFRLSDFPAGTFKTIPSRKGFKNAVKAGLVKINREIGYTGDYIKGGEIIEIFQNPLLLKKPTLKLNLDVLFEDDYLAVVYKPAGIVVSGNKKFTLENALPFNLEKSSLKDALVRPEPVHRLDYPTSGLILIGKTTGALSTLNKMFENKVIIKVYHAVTIGFLNDYGKIEAKIDNKASKTEFKVLKTKESRKYGNLNLVELKPSTGRKHQLRIHLATVGAPILGDQKYGAENLDKKGNGLLLNATALRFTHPFTGKTVSLRSDLPKKFYKFFPECSNELR